MAGDRVVASIDQLSDEVAASGPMRIQGSNSKAKWRVPTLGEKWQISTAGYSGVIDFYPDDQVVSVRAGTTIDDLQAALAERRQCIPILGQSGTIGGLVSLNLPHSLEAECGSWRDWVLGMTLVRADGTIAKSGSHAVKNVAGYDLHKLAIGARGTLFLIAELILRTYPMKSLPQPQMLEDGFDEESQIYIQRTLASDFEEALSCSRGYRAHPTSCTIWSNSEPKRFAEDWVLKQGGFTVEHPHVAEAMRRTKAIFDPKGKFNPGEMGIL